MKLKKKKQLKKEDKGKSKDKNQANIINKEPQKIEEKEKKKEEEIKKAIELCENKLKESAKQINELNEISKSKDNLIQIKIKLWKHMKMKLINIKKWRRFGVIFV